MTLSTEDKSLVIKMLTTCQHIFKADRPGLPRPDKKHNAFINAVAAELGLSNAERDAARTEGKGAGVSAGRTKGASVSARGTKGDGVSSGGTKEAKEAKDSKGGIEARKPAKPCSPRAPLASRKAKTKAKAKSEGKGEDKEASSERSDAPPHKRGRTA
ncbi:hypothetical protein CspeluHIS016_0209920 [Cutaneotrichosporon spelunceum]|uniref:Uncharacterized protein n=1 Tax=Cutaneotrichosporon spelunceum TaxID=1672016 RepID=A0AAD3TT06_9TREE|nr:hypothetical protein CspeluHIS016_0209920 [Cutaneotrichosporon spelunceum]